MVTLLLIILFGCVLLYIIHEIESFSKKKLTARAKLRVSREILRNKEEGGGGD